MNYVVFLLVAFIVPSLFISVNGFVKGLIRGTGHRFENFYLGVDTILASLVLALTDGVDPQVRLISGGRGQDSTRAEHVGTAAIIAFFMLLILMSFHQQSERRLTDLEAKRKATQDQLMNAPNNSPRQQEAKKKLLDELIVIESEFAAARSSDRKVLGYACNLIGFATMFMVVLIIRF